MNLLTAAKAALEALETCDWDDNEFPDDSQHFDRFAVSEAATMLRAAIEEAEKQEPVLYMDNRTDVVSPALRHTRKGYDTPLYLHPAPTVSEWQPIETAPKDGALKAKIDALMLEYCPEEMTSEQMDEWGKAQRPVSPEVAAAIDAAMKKGDA